MVCTPRDRGAAAVLLAILISVVTPAPSRAQAVFTDLGAAPGATAGNTVPMAINNSGQVTGSFYDAKSKSHGFLWTAGQFTIIDVPAGTFGTAARGINDAGDIVGTYYTSTVMHGFRWSGGQFTTIDPPGISGLNPYAINNLGTIVGYYQPNNGASRGFVLSQGAFTPLVAPGSSFTAAYGINDAGTIVGNYANSVNIHGFVLSGGQFATVDAPGTGCSGCSTTTPWKINNAGTIAGARGSHGFLWSAGVFSAFTPQNSPFDWATGLNDIGDVVGMYQAASGATLAYIGSRLALIDPVSELRDGAVVTTDTESLATKGRRVMGVAADGVSRVVLRIPASTAGQSFALSVLNDQQPASASQSIDEDGALGDIGGDSIARSDLTVTAVNTSAGAFAFAVYRAPVDFPRDAGQDATLTSRSVSIRVQLSTGSMASVPITLLRPPVVMIHGLWDDWTTWNTFAPLVTGAGNVDPRFSIGRLNYNAPIGKLIVSSTPRYTLNQLRRARANAFGFQFNAPSVLAQLQQWVEGFKAGRNPLGIPVAAVQVDVVAHSMGGNIARTLPLQPNFYGAATYGAGAIHKLVTVDTPHLGSTLATRLLSPQEDKGCLRGILARREKHVFSSAKLRGLGTSSGAVGDLVDFPVSPALNLLAAHATVALPASLIAGVYTDFSSIDQSSNAFLIRGWPGCWRDPLAQQLTSRGWPALFSNQATDGVVSEFSQLNGAIGLNAEFVGFVHSIGTEDFGFSPPNVLDPGAISTYVIALLNTSVTQLAYRGLTRPF